MVKGAIGRVRESERVLDELLAVRCRRGDAGAWRQLIGRRETRLLYYFRRLVGGERDAWDVLQQPDAPPSDDARRRGQRSC